MKSLLPNLDYVGQEQHKLTLHLFLQVMGKIRLKANPRKNHWWFATLYISPNGITTAGMPFENGLHSFEILLNVLQHRLEVNTSKGSSKSFELTEDLSVADFYTNLMNFLQEAGIDIKIVNKPYDLGIEKSFDKLDDYKAYNKNYTENFWKSLLWIDGVFKEFSGRFAGKTSPVHLFWHSMDLAVTRFSGERAPKMANDARLSDKDAYSHECISFGFWAGDNNVPEPAFYSYTYPSPAGLRKRNLSPQSASWQESNGSPMAILTYAGLKKEENPRNALLNFLESAYQAGARLAGWPIHDLKARDLENL